MNVRLTPDAEEQAELCDAWWRENRTAARDLFARELAATKAQLASTPKIGVIYAVVRARSVRKILMPRTRHHVY